MRNKSKSRPDRSNVDWRNQIKNGENFRKSMFYRARFEFGTFTNCDFSAVSAKHACFINADLSGCDFTGSNLEGANFGGANLTGVRFRSAILKGANFEGAITDGASFLNASIASAKNLNLSEEQSREREEAKTKQSSAWNEPEESRAFEMWAAQGELSTEDIAKVLDRTPKAILSRLAKPSWHVKLNSDFNGLLAEDNRRRARDGYPALPLSS
jgi:hypothetical protein